MPGLTRPVAASRRHDRVTRAGRRGALAGGHAAVFGGVSGFGVAVGGCSSGRRKLTRSGQQKGTVP